MKKSALLSLTALVLLPANAWSAQAAPYFPYETIDNYYKTAPEQPVPSPPTGQQPSEPVAKPPALARQPVAVTAPPEFLFPPKLGFGVAVGVPYDMMYLSKTYYYWQGGVWYRSSSYRGPWTELGYSQLPPELRKQKLAKIRELRNSEFSNYWKNKGKYQGKRYRAGKEDKEPTAEAR